MDDLKSIIGKVATGATLSRDEAASAFDSMMSGEATPSQMGGLLMALRVRGQTVDEITAAVSAVAAQSLLHRGRRRRARRQAWQPRIVVALGRCGRIGLAGGQDRYHARTSRPL